MASVPVVITDLNRDGKNDLIAGWGHHYGLHWWEQRRDGTGKRSWVRHVIDSLHSQFHTLAWVDLDNDDKPKLVTGK